MFKFACVFISYTKFVYNFWWINPKICVTICRKRWQKFKIVLNSRNIWPGWSVESTAQSNWTWTRNEHKHQIWKPNSNWTVPIFNFQNFPIRIELFVFNSWASCRSWSKLQKEKENSIDWKTEKRRPKIANFPYTSYSLIFPKALNVYLIKASGFFFVLLQNNMFNNNK